MATSLQVLNFCDQQVRPFADYMHSLYWAAKELLLNFNQQGFSSSIPFDSTPIDPSSPNDNRVQILDSDVQLILTRAQEFVNYMESAGIAANGLTSPGNPVVLNQVAKVKVNTRQLITG